MSSHTTLGLTVSALLLSTTALVHAGPGDPPIEAVLADLEGSAGGGFIVVQRCNEVTGFFEGVLVDTSNNSDAFVQESSTSCVGVDEDVLDTGANGQAAADQVASSVQLFFPGLNGNTDLQQVFAIPEPTININLEAAAKQVCVARINSLTAERDALNKRFETFLGFVQRFSDSKRSSSGGAGTVLVASDAVLDAEALGLDVPPVVAEQAAIVQERRLEFIELTEIRQRISEEEEILQNAPDFRKLEKQEEQIQNARVENSEKKEELRARIAAGEKVENSFEQFEKFDAIERELSNDLDSVSRERDVVQVARRNILDRTRREANILQGLADVNLFELAQAAQGFESDIINNAFALEKEIEALDQKIEFEKARCAEFGVSSAALNSLAASTFAFQTSSGVANVIDLEQVTLSFDAGAPGANQAFASLSKNGFLGDARLNLFASGGVVFHRDSQFNGGQNGQTVSISGGVSWQAMPELTLGLVGRFGRTDLSSSTGNTEANTFSVGGYAQAELPGQTSLTVIAAYSASDIDASFLDGGLTTTGSTTVDGFSVQAGLSRSFLVEEFLISPNVNVSYSFVDQNAFTISDGTLAPGSTTNQLTASAGLGLSRSYDLGDGIVFTPSLSFSGFANLTGEDTLLEFDGSSDGSGVFGGAFSAGVSFRAPGGVTAGVSTGLSAVDSGQINYSISGRVSIPLN